MPHGSQRPFAGLCPSLLKIIGEQTTIPLTHFCFPAAALAVFCTAAAGRTAAEPLVLTLPPPHAVSAPPPAALPGSPLLGKWHDGPCLLLPPGITRFETVSDTLTFQADGTFTQTIEKATGRLQMRGIYSVTADRLTLRFSLGTHSLQYTFSRTGDRLLLQPVGHGKAAAWTLVQGS